MMNKHNDCSKFSPNIFNKTKCQNCFRPKEVHSAEALESNRASRRVSKCGYLFVAPDWDFSVSINRSKRWQRRWFMLFDDGELTYSVDEHPDTIPQAIIDVNLVLEVADAEEVTGNKYAVSITAPDRVHFIKGTSQEESKRWFDVLSMFPRNMRGRPKRNATFPGIKTSSVNQCQDANQKQDGIPQRTRYLSCQSGDKERDLKENVPPPWNVDATDSASCHSSKLHADKEGVSRNIDHGDSRLGKQNAEKNNKVAQNKNDIDLVDEIQYTGKSRRYILRQSRGVKNQRSKSEGVAKMFPLTLDRPKWVDDLDTSPTSEKRISDANIHHSDFNIDGIGSSTKDIEKAIEEITNYSSTHMQKKKKYGLMIESSSSDNVIRFQDHSRSKSKSSRSSLIRNGHHSQGFNDEPVMRGVPDGCGNDLDTVSHHSTCSNLSRSTSEEINGSKKGWLMKLDSTQEWSRHWFVLRGTAFMFYRDQTCEEKGILDGFIDLGLIQKIEEVDLSKYYGFKITTWDNNQYVFSVSSLSLRNSWLLALAQVSNPDSKTPDYNQKAPQSFHDHDQSEKEFHNSIKDNSHLCDYKEATSKNTVPEKSQRSKSVDANFISTNKSVKNSNILMAENRALPPSPPVTRTPISRVKDKARSRSSSRTRRRSKSTSSPPLLSDETDGSPPDKGAENRTFKSPSKVTDNDKKKMTNGDIVLVELLETEVDSLKTRLEDAQKELMSLHRTNLDLQNKSSKYNPINSKDNDWSEGCISGECSSIIQSLSDECQRLRNDGNILREDYSKLQNENLKLKKEHEESARIKEDLNDIKSQCNWKEIVIQRQRSEIQSLKKNLDGSKEEIRNLFGKLNKFNKDKNILTLEIHELETKLEAADGKNCQSPLMITEDFEKEGEMEILRSQSIKAQSDVRTLKKELRKAHCLYDELELHTMKIKHDMDAVKQENQSDSRMMAERIEDLTSKLSSAERTTRQLRQKLAKAENRQERRSRSLRGGKESLTISKEMEAKLNELETKMEAIEKGMSSDVLEDQPIEIAAVDESSNLDSDTAGIFLRLNKLNSKVSSAAKITNADFTEQSITGDDRSLSEMLSDSAEVSTSMKRNADNVIQQLKMHLKYTENIMVACKQKLSQVVKRIPNIECTCLSKNNLMELKEDLSTIYDVILGQCTTDTNTPQSGLLCNAVEKMRKLLHNHVQQLSNRRQKLKAAGVHSSEIEKKLASEKLALETAVMKYLACAIHSPEHHDNSMPFWASELRMFSSCLNEVDSIINCSNGKKMLSVIKGVLQSMFNCPMQRDAMALSKSLNANDGIASNEAQDQMDTTENVKLKFEALKIHCSEVQKMLSEIYLRKVHIIIESLADNTVADNKNSDVTGLITSIRNHKSWESAHDIVEHGVVKSKMQILMSKFSRIHCEFIESESSTSACWCLTEFQDMYREHKHSEIINRIDSEICNATSLFIPEVTQFLSTGNMKSFSDNLSKESSEMLEEAVAIIVFKAILTGYLSSIEMFLKKRFSSKDFNSPSDEGMNDQIDGLIQGILTNAELSLILNQAQQLELSELVSNDTEMNAANIRESYESMLLRERDMFVNVVDNYKAQISNYEKKMLHAECTKCTQIQGNFQKVLESHQNELIAMQQQVNTDKKKIEDQYQELLKKENEKNSVEVKSLHNKIEDLMKQLEATENRYEDEVKSLREKFSEELNKYLNSNINVDLHRQQYESEIEQLRSLCKMGFGAIEKCHKHVIKEMEEKHKSQLENMKVAQEQALADETEATKVALDAIKKAHEVEIQNKLARVKKEFQINTSSGSDFMLSPELSKIKEEICNISDKLTSAKVYDSASQEKVKALMQQLVDANSQIFGLKARNRKLQVFVHERVNDMKKNLNHPSTNSNELNKRLELNEGELLKKNEELVEIKNELDVVKNRERTLQLQCNQLQQSLNVKKKVKEDEMKNFLSKLEAVTSQKYKDESACKEDFINLKVIPEQRPTELSEHKFRKPLKNLSFTYKRALEKSNTISSSKGIMDDQITLKSDV